MTASIVIGHGVGIEPHNGDQMSAMQSWQLDGRRVRQTDSSSDDRGSMMQYFAWSARSEHNDSSMTDSYGSIELVMFDCTFGWLVGWGALWVYGDDVMSSVILLYPSLHEGCQWRRVRCAFRDWASCLGQNHSSCLARSFGWSLCLGGAAFSSGMTSSP